MRESDPLDVASVVTEQIRSANESNTRALAAPDQFRKPDGTWPTETCVLCDDPIGEGRLEIGYNTCIECARKKEARGKQYAK